MGAGWFRCCSPLAFLCTRAFLAVFWLAISVWSLAALCPDETDPSVWNASGTETEAPQHCALWITKLTHWTLLLELFYLTFAVYSTYMAIYDTKVPDGVGKATPWFISVTYAMQPMADRRAAGVSSTNRRAGRPERLHPRRQLRRHAARLPPRAQPALPLAHFNADGLCRGLLALLAPLLRGHRRLHLQGARLVRPRWHRTPRRPHHLPRYPHTVDPALLPLPRPPLPPSLHERQEQRQAAGGGAGAGG